MALTLWVLSSFNACEGAERSMDSIPCNTMRGYNMNAHHNSWILHHAPPLYHPRCLHAIASPCNCFSLLAAIASLALCNHHHHPVIAGIFSLSLLALSLCNNPSMQSQPFTCYCPSLQIEPGDVLMDNTSIQHTVGKLQGFPSILIIYILIKLVSVLPMKLLHGHAHNGHLDSHSKSQTATLIVRTMETEGSNFMHLMRKMPLFGFDNPMFFYISN